MVHIKPRGALYWPRMITVKPNSNAAVRLRQTQIDEALKIEIVAEYAKIEVQEKLRATIDVDVRDNARGIVSDNPASVVSVQVKASA